MNRIEWRWKEESKMRERDSLRREEIERDKGKIEIERKENKIDRIKVKKGANRRIWR